MTFNFFPPKKRNFISFFIHAFAPKIRNRFVEPSVTYWMNGRWWKHVSALRYATANTYARTYTHTHTQIHMSANKLVFALNSLSPPSTTPWNRYSCRCLASTTLMVALAQWKVGAKRLQPTGKLWYCSSTHMLADKHTLHTVEADSGVGTTTNTTTTLLGVSLSDSHVFIVICTHLVNNHFFSGWPRDYKYNSIEMDISRSIVELQEPSLLLK